MKVRKKKIIGRRELVDFPDLDLFDIEAKIDTGAYTSSIHCRDVKHFEQEGIKYVSFVLLDHTHPQYDNREFTLPLFDQKQIRNSFGHTEDRYIICTRIKLFDIIYDVEISLADRSLMDYPVLLGRKALRRRFLVDVSKVNRWYKRKMKKK